MKKIKVALGILMTCSLTVMASPKAYNAHADKAPMYLQQNDKPDINAVTNAYLAVQKALAADDFDKAKEAANKLAVKLEGNASATAQKMQDDAQKIGTSKDLDEARQYFASLSEKMYTLHKEQDSDQELYWQHCPMALNGQGANWISDTEEIHNPYLGHKMPHCGVVKEEL